MIGRIRIHEEIFGSRSGKTIQIRTAPDMEYWFAATMQNKNELLGIGYTWTFNAVSVRQKCAVYVCVEVMSEQEK
jgi:hypothetical protein